MKDQKHNEGKHEEKHNAGHANQGQSHDKNGNHSESHSERSASTSQPKSPTDPKHEGSEAADRAGKMKEAGKFSGIDNEKMSALHSELENDETLRSRFQQDPDSVLKEKGIELPEGVRASYDHQYVKPSDGSQAGLYGYRVGNINFSR